MRSTKLDPGLRRDERTWRRYSMHVRDGEILKLFAEPGLRDEPSGVGLEVSDAETMLGYLRGVK